MNDAIIVAIITGFFAFLGTYISNRKSSALVEYRLEELEKKVAIHNGVIERTYKLEQVSAVRNEEMKVCQNRIADLENEVRRLEDK